MAAEAPQVNVPSYTIFYQKIIIEFAKQLCDKSFQAFSYLL